MARTYAPPMRKRLLVIGALTGAAVFYGARVADAHFILQAPAAMYTQDGSGLPEKSAPCGQADPGTPAVATNTVDMFVPLRFP